MSIPIHYAKWIAEFHARPTTLLSGSTITGKAETNGYHPEDIIGRAGLHAKDASSAHQLLISKLLEIGFTLMTFDRCEQAYDRRQRLGHDWEDHRLALNLSYEKPIELGYKTAAALQLVAGTENGEDNSEDYLIITEHEIKPLVHDPELSHWDQPWIDADLKELLFGKSDNKTATEAADNLEKPLKTYLILDAAARKRVTKVFDIDEIPGMGVEIQCLFKGEAAETYEEVAPYLVDMTLPDGVWDDADLVPEFHKDFFKNHWDKSEGIFVRSRASLDELKQHFRKFTQIQDETGKWYWFRFYDPKIIASYFNSIKRSESKSQSWFVVYLSLIVETIIAIGVNICQIKPAMVSMEKLSKQAFGYLTQTEIDGFKINRKTQFDMEVAENIQKNFKQQPWLLGIKESSGDRTADISIDLLVKYITDLRVQCDSKGFTSQKSIAQVVLASLILGQSFDSDPRISVHFLTDYIDKKASEYQRLNGIKELCTQWQKDVYSANKINLAIEVILNEINQDLNYEHDPSFSYRIIQPELFDNMSKLQHQAFQKKIIIYAENENLSEAQSNVLLKLGFLFGPHFPDSKLYNALWNKLREQDWRQELRAILERYKLLVMV